MNKQPNQIESADRLLRTARVCELLDMCPEALYVLVKEQRLTPVRLGKRILRFRQSEIRRLVEGRM